MERIDLTDGSVADWYEVLGEPALTASDFYWLNYHYDPSELDFRIWLALAPRKQHHLDPGSVKKQAILPVAWVGAVLMATAVVLSMPDKAQANTCWLNWGCNNAHPYWCKSICQGNDACGDGWACAKYGSAGYRCKCFQGADLMLSRAVAPGEGWLFAAPRGR